MKTCHDNAITLENIVTNGNTRGDGSSVLTRIALT